MIYCSLCAKNDNIYPIAKNAVIKDMKIKYLKKRFSENSIS
ncbi:MAG: hypothetical protein PUG48_02815 [Clostridia bacterium]|nr:hypothetical protein [Clostridia bacterium]